MHRRVVSWGAAALGRLVLGLGVNDVTSGFAAFRRETIEPLLSDLNPKGFKLLMEILGKSPAARVKETPITFVNRRSGKSKLSVAEALKFIGLCVELGHIRLGATPARRSAA